ncbi:hypothetical protein EJ04DRAFT_453232 [Polyplosphaeria fusca]|uniref:Rhodopsin domain-containing protein n=1 Tax=Polyplosphaeria fusca TaxID=682080 RepID=A0A9P4QJ59_9PLEO|nr:hypothetical protein EJ04DRAFT_453232 [Polyplosphaeria fusca]
MSPDYLAESKQADLYAADITTYIAAVVAVALRFQSRRMKAAPFWIDDWLIVGAMICATAMLGNFGWWVAKGYGKHREASGVDIDFNLFLGFFIAEIVYTLIIVLVKFSILALYWRVFGKNTVRWPVLILTAIVSAWGIAVLFLSIFTCVPPKAFWDKSVKGAHCGVDNKKFLWGISIPNIITDVALLLLPVPYVVMLRASWSQRRLLVGTFFLGGFVCIASVLRLISVVRQDQGPDASWNWVDQGIWAVIESNFAIISACLPTLRPIWTWMLGSSSNNTESPTSSGPRVLTIGSGPSKSNRKRTAGDSLLEGTVTDFEHPFYSIEDQGELHGHARLRRSSAGLTKPSEHVELQQINVKHAIG